jgi:hypothetical protein
MITLSLAKWLEQEGFGTLEADIFWEEIALDNDGKPKDGIWVVSRSPSVTRLNVGIQNFDIYARYANKITTEIKLKQILNRLQEAYGDVCTLPSVEPYSSTAYINVTIEPVSGVENVGSDDQDKIVKVISGIVHYEEQ